MSDMRHVDKKPILGQPVNLYWHDEYISCPDCKSVLKNFILREKIGPS